MATNPPSSINWRDQVAQRQKELGVTPAAAPGVVNPALPRKPDVKFIEPSMINDFSPRPRAPGESRASPVVRDVIYSMTPEGRAYNSGGTAPARPGATAAQPERVTVDMAGVREAAAATDAARARPNQPPNSLTPEERASMNTAVENQRTYNEASGAAPPATPMAATGGLARRSAVDEFNDIRTGIARPGMYDPSGATSRARGAATSVVRSNSDANRILQMAANLASDPRLKGFPGARNAIIQGLVGQIGADSDAALEGLRQAGNAGISGQEFDQDGVLQETGRRGQALRDQFLTENEERLARINNDADMQQLLTNGAIQLEAARIGGRGRSGSGGNSEQINRADDYLEAAMEMNPEDPVAAGLQAYERAVAAGLDVEGLPGTQEAYQNIVGPLRDQFNTRSFVRDGIESLTTGNAGSETQLGYDFNINDLEVPEDQPWLVDLAQIISPASSQPYVVQQRGKPETARTIRPLDGAPSEAQLRRAQMLQRTNLQRRGDFE